MRCEIHIPSDWDGKILCVGEAPGKEEELVGTPFVGRSGRELRDMLSEAGITNYAKTNVFMDRPKNNKLKEDFCVSKKEATQLAKDAGWSRYDLAPVVPSGYVPPYRALELLRLRQEICEHKPNLVLALGGTAYWALSGTTGISRNRGAVFESSLVPGQKVLATFHPAAVLRAWENRPVSVADFCKAKHEAESKDISRPARTVYLSPELSDIVWFFEQHFFSSQLCGIDIETVANSRFISSIAFAPRSDLAMVVPFINIAKSTCYWNEWETESQAWNLVATALRSTVPKVFQNGNYDVQVLAYHGIPVMNYLHDTMLLHHSLHPEMKKSLSFLGSLYTNELAWKSLRPRAKSEKKEDD